jgi:hypothetical protein
VRLHNTGAADTPIIEDLRALDLRFAAPGTGDIHLHQVNGSSHNRLEEDYLPIEEDVGPGDVFSLMHYKMKGVKAL